MTTDELTDELTEIEAFYKEISGELTARVAKELAKLRQERKAQFPGMVVPFELTPQEIGWLVTQVASYLALRMRVTCGDDARAAIAGDHAVTPVREYVAIWAQTFDYGGEPPHVDTLYFAERFQAYTVQDVIQVWTLTRKRAPFETGTRLLRVLPFEAVRYSELLPPSGPTPWNDQVTDADRAL